MQLLHSIQAASASHIKDGNLEVALKVTFDFQSNGGAYPESTFCVFKRGQKPDEVIEGLRSMIRHLETKISKQ